MGCIYWQKIRYHREIFRFLMFRSKLEESWKPASDQTHQALQHKISSVLERLSILIWVPFYKLLPEIANSIIIVDKMNKILKNTMEVSSKCPAKYHHSLVFILDFSMIFPCIRILLFLDHIMYQQEIILLHIQQLLPDYYKTKDLSKWIRLTM